VQNGAPWSNPLGSKSRSGGFVPKAMLFDLVCKNIFLKNQKALYFRKNNDRIAV
jgi:hypothetical protein